MTNDQLLGYIRQQLAAGVDRSAIVANLKGVGWNENDINEGFEIISPSRINEVSFSVPSSPVVPSADLSMPETNNATPKKSQHLFLGILFIIVLLGVGGSALYAYYSGAFVTLPALLEKTAVSSGDITSLSYEISSDIDMTEVNNTSVNSLPLGIDLSRVKVNMKGQVNNADKENIKNSINLSLDLGMFSVKASVIFIGKDSYFKVTELPQLFSLMLPNAPDFLDKWFSYDASEYVTKASVEITKEQKQYLVNIAKKMQILASSKKLNSETINGELSYHFAFDINEEQLGEYLVLGAEYLNSSETDPVKKEAFDKEILKNQLSKLRDFSGDIWIGRNSNMVQKINIAFNVFPDPAKTEKVKVLMAGNFSDRNVPVEIIAPASSVPFMSLIQPSLDESAQRGNEAVIKSQLANMRALAELYYDANVNYSYDGLCNSKDTISTETKIKSAGGKGFFCRAKSQNYIMGAQFPDRPEYWCIDSRGGSVQNKKLPTGTYCVAD